MRYTVIVVLGLYLFTFHSNSCAQSNMGEKLTIGRYSLMCIEETGPYISSIDIPELVKNYDSSMVLESVADYWEYRQYKFSNSSNDVSLVIMISVRNTMRKTEEAVLHHMNAFASVYSECPLPHPTVTSVGNTCWWSEFNNETTVVFYRKNVYLKLIPNNYSACELAHNIDASIVQGSTYVTYVDVIGPIGITSHHISQESPRVGEEVSVSFDVDVSVNDIFDIYHYGRSIGGMSFSFVPENETEEFRIITGGDLFSDIYEVHFYPPPR